MPKFYSKSNKQERKPLTYNNQNQNVWRVTRDEKTGERKLKIEKTVNIYNKIQEYKDEVDLKSILERHAIDLHNSALKDAEAQLIDLTNLPQNLMEAMNVIDAAKYTFDRQSTEIKAKFDNDFSKFIAASENGQLADLLHQQLKTEVTKFSPEIRAQMQATAIQTVTPEQVAQQNTTQGVNLNV